MGIRRTAALALLTLAAAMALAAASPAASGETSAAATETWQASALDLPSAWQVTSGNAAGNAAPVVAVVDSGVQPDDPALQDHLLPGYDVVGGDTNTGDDNGHGTAVADVVASVCPDCRILPVKVLDANATGDWTTIAAGVDWAADHGAQVINLSVGAPRAMDVLGAAVAQAIAKGVIVVAAAGNDGENESFYPAMYPNVISVAGVDQGGARSTWSNFGSWVTVAAPGCSMTPWLHDGSPASFCGTSAAAPFVAGLAGLALAFDPKLDATTFAAALATSTTPLPDPATAASGIPDANRLLETLGAPTAPPVESAPPTVSPAPAVGRRCTASAGEWQGTSSRQITWQRFTPGAGWAGIASGATYTPGARDAGRRLRVLVTATNVRGTVTAVSPASPPVRVTRVESRKRGTRSSGTPQKVST